MTPLQFARPFFGEEEAMAAADAVRSGWVVGGPRLAEFERRFAALGGAPHGIGCSSWTTGAFLVLKAWGIGPGDEVIVPSLTFIASVNVIVHVGATPIFADVEPATFNVDPNDVAAKITSRTRAVIAVDQIGLPCRIDEIRAIAEPRGIHVLQDAACSFGSRSRGRPVGSLAEVSVFSLHARKVVTTGEGGMILTADAELAERLRRLRHQGMSLSDFARHGAAPTLFESYPEVGYNARMTDIQAAVGLAQLDRLDTILARRRAVAEVYNAGLSGHPLLEPPHVPEGLAPNWQSYQTMVREDGPLSRAEIMDRLFAIGIPTRRGVMASHREAPYAAMPAHLPNTEVAADRGLQLPMHPGMEPEDAARVLDALSDLVA